VRESINIDVLTNWVCMLRAEVDGAVWLADDDVDARFYERLAHEKSRIVPCRGSAIPLLHSVEQRGTQGVVAVVRGIATANDAHNIFRPARGDVASLLLMSSHGQTVMTEIVGHVWLSAAEKEVGSLRNRILQIASSIATIRSAYPARASDLLKPESLHQSIDWSRLELSWPVIQASLEDEPITEIQQRCEAHSRQDVEGLIAQCEGVDAIHLFASSTQFYRPRGLQPYRQVDASTCVSMLRVAFQPSDIEGDQLFWKMKKWERCHPRYPLLSRWRELDPLGVVWDQRYWEKDLAALLKTLEPAAMLALLKMDLDNFKAVNERLGHTAGDEAIRVYCATVREVCSGNGEVYRRGGDEVVVLAPGLSQGTARELAESIRATVEVRFAAWAQTRDLESGPTASIGLTLASSDEHVASILERLDIAQKNAKTQGKNRVVVLTEG
jgi:diguanylate cyclase (GGDEF)-like protein